MEEESGDRWYGSDPAKALRYYQCAYEMYGKAAAEGEIDGRYNALRLLFQVYGQYQKVDGVSISDLVGTLGFAGTPNAVVQDLPLIVRHHEDAIAESGEGAPSDLLFNAAVVYTDAIAEADLTQEVFHMAQRAMALIERLLNQEFSQTSEGTAKEPSEIMDVAIAALHLAQAVLEAVEANEVETANSLVGPFVQRIDAMAGSLQGSAPELQTEYLVARTYAQALAVGSLDDASKTWEEAGLPDTAEVHMLAADCLETLMHRSGLNARADVDPATYWAVLGRMGLHYKKAQDLLNEKLLQAKGVSTGDTIAQMSKVCTARAEVDLQRARLPVAAAATNGPVLMRNTLALLKNALTIAKRSGGLRETRVEKLQKEHRRLEAVVRLCVLENKSSEEMDAIVGAGRWQLIFEQVSDLWYYRDPGATSL